MLAMVGGNRQRAFAQPRNFHSRSHRSNLVWRIGRAIARRSRPGAAHESTSRRQGQQFCSELNSSALWPTQVSASLVATRRASAVQRRPHQMKLSPMKLTHPPMRGDEVKVWQRFLQSKGIYSGSINDSFDEATAAATARYAERNYLRGDDVFVISFDRPDRDHFTTKDGSVDLRSSIHDVLSKIAYGYYL